MAPAGYAGGWSVVCCQRQEDFAPAFGVGSWESGDLVVEFGQVGAAALGGFEEFVVQAEEVAGVIDVGRGGRGLDGFDAEH